MRKDWRYRVAIQKFEDWQVNPNSLTTPKVQLWSPDVMLTAQMPLTDAQEFVKTGKCFVISDQAIGFINRED